jgi:glycerol kinase
LRDGLGVIRDGAHAGELAASVPDTAGVTLVPAFAGLGAPYWDPDARGAILGLSRGATVAHIARAALEGTAFPTAELVEAMASDGIATERMKVDGGMSRNDWFLQTLADTLGVEICRPINIETTALGAAILAAVGLGMFDRLEDAASLWRPDREFKPNLDRSTRAERLAHWKSCVRRVRSEAPHA